MIKTNFEVVLFDGQKRAFVASGQRLRFVADLFSKKSKRQGTALERAARKAVTIPLS